MKKSTEIFGFILAFIIAGSGFGKVNHLTGSGIGITLGLGLLLLIFLIRLTINFYKEKKVLLPLIFGSASIYIFSLGVLFQIQHWPGGYNILQLGLVFSLLTFLVLGLIEVPREPAQRTFSVIAVSFTIIAIALIYVATFRTVTHNVINGLLSSNEALMKSNNVLGKSNSNRYKIFYLCSPEKSQKYIQLKNLSDSLYHQIEFYKKRLATIANGNPDFSSYSEIHDLYDVDIANRYMLENGNAAKLKVDIERYLAFIQLNNSLFHIGNQIYQLMDIKDPPAREVEKMTWEMSKFLNVPLICAITNLSALQLNIRTVEMIIMDRKD